VNPLDEQIDEAVGDFPTAEPAQCRDQRRAERWRVRSQFIWSLGRGALTEAFDDSQRDVIEHVVGQSEGAQALELADLGEDTFQTDGAGAGLQLVEDRSATLRCLSIGSVIGTAGHKQLVERE
jgi:hypothetical protein